MHRLSIRAAGSAIRFSKWAAMAAALGFLACAGTTAGASSVVVEISGDFGSATFGNYPAPLDGGQFSGTVTFASLPGPDDTVLATAADVNFYTGGGQLLFAVVGAGYDKFIAGPSGYESLSVTGDTSVGGIGVSVSGLSLSFDDWSFGSGLGTVQPYAAPGYSSIEYTYATGGGTTYYNPVTWGQASVPEPSTLALGLVGTIGVLIFARRDRRRAVARPVGNPSTLAA